MSSRLSLFYVSKKYKKHLKIRKKAKFVTVCQLFNNNSPVLFSKNIIIC